MQTTISRRGLLGFFAATALVAADPEKLVWVPGKKLISIPTPVERYVLEFSGHAANLFVKIGKEKTVRIGTFPPGEYDLQSSDIWHRKDHTLAGEIYTFAKRPGSFTLDKVKLNDFPGKECVWVDPVKFRQNEDGTRPHSLM